MAAAAAAADLQANRKSLLEKIKREKSELQNRGSAPAVPPPPPSSRDPRRQDPRLQPPLPSNVPKNPAAAAAAAAPPPQTFLQRRESAAETSKMLADQQQQALAHAHQTSDCFFITQDSAYGNLIIPVIPRLEAS